MGKASVDKGIAFEDMVEVWLSLKGLAYEKRPRIMSPIGFYIEVDFLVYDSKGKIIVEAKNLEKPVDRDVVMKVWNNVVILGAYKAIIVSSSGYTESAVKLAKRLGRVELYTLEEIVREVESIRFKPQSTFIEPILTPWTALKWVEDKVAERKLFIFKTERGESIESIYIPLFYIRCKIPVDQGKVRETRILVSALTGLPLAYDQKSRIIYDALEHIVDLPKDILEIYRVHAGRRVARSEIIQYYGESTWIRLMKHLTPRGLVKRITERPVTVEIINIYPTIDALEQVVESIEKTRKTDKPQSDFEVKEQLYSQGSITLFLEQVLRAKTQTIIQLYAPVYKVKLVDNRGNYRNIIVAGWIKEPTIYNTKYFI
ncbi:MAG: restriction endonuclease [Acidilobaceae archaeon]